MLTGKKILSVVAVFAFAAGIYGYNEYTRGNKDLSDQKADYRIEVKDLVKEFENDEENANKKFLDKILAVTGIIKEIVKDDNGSYTIMLGGQIPGSSIRCSLDPGHPFTSGVLQVQREITIKGACTGFNADELLGSDVILNRCVIEEK